MGIAHFAQLVDKLHRLLVELLQLRIRRTLRLFMQGRGLAANVVNLLDIGGIRFQLGGIYAVC